MACYTFLLFNPNWHEIRKQEICSSSAPLKSKFYKTQWAWQGVKLTWFMAIFDENSARKIWSKKDKKISPHANASTVFWWKPVRWSMAATSLINPTVALSLRNYIVGLYDEKNKCNFLKILVPLWSIQNITDFSWEIFEKCLLLYWWLLCKLHRKICFAESIMWIPSTTEA